MSGIFGKTIESLNSLLSPLASSVGLSPKYMFERCLGARTKREEEWCFQDALRTVQQRLSEPGVRPSSVKKLLAFVVFAEMMGYKAEFAYIHAVKLAQQGSLSEKKMGYMVCVQLLEDSHPLSMLLVNTIVRDLASRNMFTISMALAATCHLIPPDQASAVLPMVVDKLSHSNEYIRGRAVVVLHHFLRSCPSQAVHYMHRVCALLGDSDPGVVALVLQYLDHLSEGHAEYARELWPSVLSIQEQILNGRLPKDYLHHGVSAPWTQLTILRLLRHLQPPLQDVHNILCDTLKAASGEGNLSSGSNSSLGTAITIECLTTMLELSSPSLADSTQLKSSTMSTVGHLLASSNTNFRYEGLGLLQTLVAHHQVTLTRDQQTVVLRCLQHPDNAVKLKTLNLLCVIADSSTAESICNQVIDYLKNQCSNETLRSQLVTLGITLVEKFPSSNNYWHLAALLRLLPMSAEQSQTIQSHLKLSLLPSSEAAADGTVGNIPRRKVLTYLTKHSESKVAPTSILELYVWTLSHFHHLLNEEDGAPSDAKTHLVALERIVSLGQKVLSNQVKGVLEIVPSEIHMLMLEIVEAARHLIETSGEPVSSLAPFLNEIISATVTRVFGDAALRCACEELLNMLQSCTEVCLVSKGMGGSDTFDLTLTFLDEFVCSDLEKDGIPYEPMPVKVSSRAGIQLALETERNQGNLELANSVLLAAACSLGSSELSLAGTESGANNLVESVSSVGSADSKCWTFTSPTQDLTLIPVWTKEGRVKGEPEAQHSSEVEGEASCSDSTASPAHVLQVKVPLESSEPVISSWLKKASEEDPLDELQKDFVELSFQKSPQVTQQS